MCSLLVFLLKILILGCGSIGSRHASNLKKLGVKDIILCDNNGKRVNKLGEKLHITKIFTDYKIAVKEIPDIFAVLICIPTKFHVDYAIFFARKRIHLFIEKPLSNNLKNIKILERISKQNKIKVMMGHVYFFDDGFNKIKSLLDEKSIGKILHVSYLQGSYLPDWHPKMDYRNEYSARKNMGGGALLTLTSHSFYVLEWIIDEIKNIHGEWVGRMGSLDIDVDDTAFFLFETKKGVIIESHNDFLSRIHQHKLIIEGEKGRLEYDFVKKKIDILITNQKPKKINVIKNNNDRFLKEIKYFIELISTKNQPDKNLKLEKGIHFLKFMKKTLQRL